ncbi:hypothetical protein KI387_044036 [Taxus chinensis]|uniref:Uncharacterized protein n=1 Tax=Taxus chinensis TaxID=29808 RepID=A0AA38LAG4_TAXCH|nr:hypothetical protein KI387_044036 [Taxus chinensis]
MHDYPDATLYVDHLATKVASHSTSAMSVGHPPQRSERVGNSQGGDIGVDGDVGELGGGYAQRGEGSTTSPSQSLGGFHFTII